jgi:5'-nucleotidase
MKILLTNDDGIDSEGLQTLKRFLANGHEVWTVAPDIERSGTSHAITLRDPVRFNALDNRTYSCGGTPADCILYSLLGAIPFTPQVIISGINHGPNIGTDIIYSGTVAAARQAALMGFPGIAISVTSYEQPLNFPAAAAFLADNIEQMVSLWHSDHFLNINVPNSIEGGGNVVVTHPARRIYRDNIVDFTAPQGEKYFFLDGSLNDAVSDTGSDWHAVINNDISVSPIYLHPVNDDEDEKYRKTVFSKPLVSDRRL